MKVVGIVGKAEEFCLAHSYSWTKMAPNSPKWSKDSLVFPEIKMSHRAKRTCRNVNIQKTVNPAMRMDKPENGLDKIITRYIQGHIL